MRRSRLSKALIISGILVVAMALFIAGYIAGYSEVYNNKLALSQTEAYTIEINETAKSGEFDTTIHTMQMYLSQDEDDFDLTIEAPAEKLNLHD